MFNIKIMEKIHPTFERLLLAANRIKGINSQAELARDLNLSEQNMTNWKSRGVPKAFIIDLADEWGFRTKWLRFNDGNMTSDYVVAANSPEASVMMAMKQMDYLTKYQVVKIINSLAEPEKSNNGTHQ